jgi:hypothetical protein
VYCDYIILNTKERNEGKSEREREIKNEWMDG